MLNVPEWAKKLFQVAVSVGGAVLALSAWTYARGATDGVLEHRVLAIEQHVTDPDVHFGRDDAERLARVEEGVNSLKEGFADLKKTMERSR